MHALTKTPSRARFGSLQTRLGTLLLGFGLVASASAQTANQLLPLDINPPAAINRSFHLSPTPKDTPLHLAISLKFGDSAGMEKFAESVSDPKSPDYRKFLTPRQVGERFGPQTWQVDRVADFLKQSGFKITMISQSRISILADGTVAMAEKAFRTHLREFALMNPVGNEDPHFRAFTVAPSVPADLKPLIVDIAGLETFTRPKAQGYLTPGQVRSLYNIAPLYSAGKTGLGRSIGISSWDGFRLSPTLTKVYAQWGLPSPAGGIGSNVTVVPVPAGGGTGGTTPQGEADLDIQTILTVAPLANLYIYDGTGGNLIDVLTKEANDNLADIISESYGWRFGSDTTAVAAHNQHLTMAAQGITYMAASGDSGTDISGYPYPDYDPEVLSVGGTTATVDVNGNRATETGWNGSGGGWVVNGLAFNTRPTWQVGTGVPNNINYRMLPDLALAADPNTGYVVYLAAGVASPGFYIIGGTSGASPTFAAGLAIAQQQMISLGTLPATAGKYRHGRIQNLLYSFNGNSSLFFDVVSGANGNLPNGTPSTAKVGWDFVTGWGALNIQAFSNTGNTPPTLSSLTLSANTIFGGTSVTGTVTLSKTAPTGGTVVTLASNNPVASLPASVTVAAGVKTATFTVTTPLVGSSATATITGTLDASTANATLTVNPYPAPTSFTLTYAQPLIPSASTGTGTVTLDNPAPIGGFVVNLTTSNAALATVPASITIPAGALSANFTTTTGTVAVPTKVTIAARRTGFTTVAFKPTVLPPAVTSISLSQDAVVGGNGITGTVMIASAAPAGGVTVTLGSSKPLAATMPASVVVPAGTTVVNFAITTHGVAAATTAVLKASVYPTTPVTKNLLVKQASFSGFAFDPATIQGGSPTTGTVTLDGEAPPAGYVITLTSPYPAVLSVPASVTVPAGGRSATFTATSFAVKSNTSVKVVARGASGAKDFRVYVNK